MQVDKLVFICRDLSSQRDGGVVVARRNLTILQNICKEVATIEVRPCSLWRTIFNILLLRPYNYSSKIGSEIAQYVSQGYSTFFLDGSLYGKVAKHLVKKNIKVITFYHNVEYEYFRQRFAINNSLLGYIYLQYVKYNEYLSTKYSTRIIAISDRDSRELLDIYNRKSDLILPTTFLHRESYSVNMATPSYSLFVGSNFYANQEGILWYIENVLDYQEYDLIVVGSICSYLENLRIKSSKLKLLGFVDNIDDYYKNAAFVISPIFSGSGLKTKTIEALSYGKYIIGTPESFIGISDSSIGLIGAQCQSAQEFIDCINNLYVKDISGALNYFHSPSYEIYLLDFTHESAEKKLNGLLNL